MMASSTSELSRQGALSEPEGRFKTSSIGFQDPSFDESVHARRVARALGTDDHEKILGPREAVDVVERLPDLLDEPLGDASLVPTFLRHRVWLGFFKPAEPHELFTPEACERMEGPPSYAEGVLTKTDRASMAAPSRFGCRSSIGVSSSRR